MNCDKFNQCLEMYVLECLDDEQRLAVRLHLELCPTCRQTELEYRRLIGRIKESVPPVGKSVSDIGRSLNQSIANEIRQVRRRSMLKLAIVKISAAAAIIMLCLGAWHWHSAARHNPSASSTSPSMNQLAAMQVWQKSGALSMMLSPADGIIVRGQRMYRLLNEGQSGRVSALDTQTGEELWQSTVKSIGYLAADEERIYCLVSGKTSPVCLVALDCKTGRELWRTPSDASDRITLPVRPVVIKGLGVCWAGNKKIGLWDPSGRPVWSRAIENEGMISCPAAVGDKLYVASSSTLYCLNVRDGQQEWRKTVSLNSSGFVRPMLAAAPDAVFIAARDQTGRDYLNRISLSGDKADWSRLAPYVKCLTVAEGQLYVRGQSVQALDMETGQPLWSFKASGCGPVACYDGQVYFVDAAQKSGRLIALDARTGSKTWHLDGISSCDAFSKVGNTGYIKTQDGVVHAIAMAGM